MLTPEHRRTPIAHPAPVPFALAPARLASYATPAPSVPSAPVPVTFNAPVPFALAPARLASYATPAPSVPSAPVPVTFNNRTYHHLNPSLAVQLAALPPIPAPVRGRGRGCGRATNHASNAAPGPSRIPIYPQVRTITVENFSSYFECELEMRTNHTHKCEPPP
jgi:hypothetical protein